MFQQEEEEGRKTRIILASASPRREKILRDLGLDFEVVLPDRGLEQGSRDAVGTVVDNSIKKAQNVREKLKEEGCRYLVSGFDTIVCMQKKIFGKPSDIKEAYSFIEALSGKVHQVITGICIIDSDSGKYLTGKEISKVKFKDLGQKEIESYIAREKVLDKAGAYNIAGQGALLVEKVQGCQFNIAGVPVFRYLNLLERFDYKIL